MACDGLGILGSVGEDVVDMPLPLLYLRVVTKLRVVNEVQEWS